MSKPLTMTATIRTTQAPNALDLTAKLKAEQAAERKARKEQDKK